MDSKTLRSFIETFHFLQNFNCLEAIDQMFLKLIKADWDTESLETNKMLIVTFLRTNHMIRDRLSNYQEFLKKSKKYLQDNNIEPKDLLHGIID